RESTRQREPRGSRRSTSTPWRRSSSRGGPWLPRTPFASQWSLSNSEGEPLAAGLTPVSSALLRPRAAVELLPFRRPPPHRGRRTEEIIATGAAVHLSLRRWFTCSILPQAKWCVFLLQARTGRPNAGLGRPCPGTAGGPAAPRSARQLGRVAHNGQSAREPRGTRAWVDIPWVSSYSREG